MTKIAITQVAQSDATFDSFLDVFAALPVTSIIAYNAKANLLYVRDEDADAALSYLARAGIRAEAIRWRH